MARATDCVFGGREIGIEEALRLRDAADERPDFRCAECGEPVIAHKGSRIAGAHFEHGGRNAACSRSDPAR